jgi:predicted Rossmann fold nucleotide-binding protein DprA/Smf involved in DNA uptake
MLDFAAENNFEVIVLPRDFFDRKSKGNLLALKEGCFPVFDFEELIELLSS